MSYQFAHVETYSRKKDKNGIDCLFVFDENSRRNPAACLHVENPQPPVLVYGMPVEDVERLHDELCEQAKTTNNKGQTRSIRKDQHTLFTVVLSHPGNDDMPDFEDGTPQDVASVAEWEKRSVAWLRQTYGDKLKSVVRHDDEGYPHLHALILNDEDPSLMAKKLHPGQVAKDAFMRSAEAKAMDSKTANKQGDRLYRSAMREWQDDYFAKVGLVCGLNRLGPGRRRLSKREYNLESKATQSVRVAEKRAGRATKKAKEAEAKAEKFEKAGTLVGAVSSAVAGGVVQVSESFTKSRFDEGAKSRENEIHLLKTQNEKLKSNNSSLKTKIHKSSESRKSLLNELKKEREKSFDKGQPFRDLQKKNEQLETYLGLVFDSLDSHGINPVPFIKTVYTLDDLMKDCDRIAKEWLESFQSTWGPQQQAKPQKGSDRSIA